MDPFGSHSKDQQDLPPPFLTPGGAGKDKQYPRGCVGSVLMQGRKHPQAKPFKIGQDDVEPGSRRRGPEEGGMIVGPEHSGFWQDPDQDRTRDSYGSSPGAPGFLPPYPFHMMRACPNFP